MFEEPKQRWIKDLSEIALVTCIFPSSLKKIIIDSFITILTKKSKDIIPNSVSKPQIRVAKKIASHGLIANAFCLTAKVW